MNYMKDVAELLGVNLGEEFEIEGNPFKPYKLTEKGLIDRNDYKCDYTLTSLLMGECKVIKKPKKGDGYYSIRIGGSVDVLTWFEDTYDYMAIALGNCFRTEEEAKEHKDEVLEKLGIKL